MHSLTIELPDTVFPLVAEQAERRGVSVETLLRDDLLKLYAPENWEWGEVTAEERRAVWQRALEREDLWGSEADSMWDSWQPSNPATS
jgi:hypothetical protein